MSAVMGTAAAGDRVPLPTAVIFDFDGLILETEWAEFCTIAEVFTRHGTSLSEDLWRSFIGRIDHPHWCDILEEQLGRTVDQRVLKAARAAAAEPVLAGLEILPGVGELIAGLTTNGVSLAVASSSDRPWVERHLRRVGLFDRFEAIATGDEVPLAKPAPDVYLLACSRLGVDPGQAVAIEDSPTGCHAARSAGISVIAVPSVMTRGMNFDHANLVVDTALELDPLVLGDLVRR